MLAVDGDDPTEQQRMLADLIALLASKRIRFGCHSLGNAGRRLEHELASPAARDAEPARDICGGVTGEHALEDRALIVGQSAQRLSPHEALLSLVSKRLC